MLFVIERGQLENRAGVHLLRRRRIIFGLLLAQMAEEHEVALTDPVQKLLGDSIMMPKSEREITLVDLATHTSGLPRMPGNFNYKLGGSVTATVSREGDQLLVQLPGRPKIRFYPESKVRFFCRKVEAAVSFEGHEEGRIKQLVIHQNGKDLPAPKTK
ncbi:MAG: serine hydrolase [Planctomycetia bacterium]|nr:serine hydrolase [Planctomycetia bacterium]